MVAAARVKMARKSLGLALRDFRGWMCLAWGMLASAGSNTTKSREEITWMRAFGFLAEKTTFRSSLMGPEFVLDLLNCSGPQNTQVFLSETLQMFQFKALAGTAAGGCGAELPSAMCSHSTITTTPKTAQ